MRVGARRDSDGVIRDFVFLQRLAQAHDPGATARALAEECWLRHRQPCVVLLRRGARWRLAAVVGCQLPPHDARHLQEPERWLAAATSERS